METLAEWISRELERREWRQADLAHRAQVPDATISRLLSGSRQAGPGVCTALARALDVPPEQVFRMAGILPPLPPVVEEEREAMLLFRALDEGMRRVALGMLRVLHARKTGSREGEGERAADAEDRPRTFSQRLAWEIAKDLETMPLADQQQVYDLMVRLTNEGRGTDGRQPSPGKGSTA